MKSIGFLILFLFDEPFLLICCEQITFSVPSPRLPVFFKIIIIVQSNIACEFVITVVYITSIRVPIERHTSSMITRFLIYGAIGCLMEVLWTGLGSLLNRDYKLQSHTSIWMFFIYGMVVFFEPVFRLTASWPFLFRGVLYSVSIFIGEYITGSLLKVANICPWDYSQNRFHYNGLIRWDYAPAWAVAGLFFERVYWLIVS